MLVFFFAPPPPRRRVDYECQLRFPQYDQWYRALRLLAAGGLPQGTDVKTARYVDGIVVVIVDPGRLFKRRSLLRPQPPPPPRLPRGSRRHVEHHHETDRLMPPPRRRKRLLIRRPQPQRYDLRLDVVLLFRRSSLV